MPDDKARDHNRARTTQMETELISAGWTPQPNSQWQAPKGQVFTGVEFCWRIMKGDQWSKQLLHR